MDVVKTSSSLTLAAAAAAMFALAPVSASAGETHNDVRCMGVNACKGRSTCKTAESSCKGHNSCKGHGFVMVSEEVCEQLGGTVG